MIQKRLFILILLACCCFSTLTFSAAVNEGQILHPLYFGALGGYGSTTWEGLVPSLKNQNPAVSMSAPIKVEEGGGVWGVFLGYEMIPNLALEGSYMEFPDARVRFDPISLFSFEQNGDTYFITHTEAFSLLGKVMIPIPKTNFLLYSGAGAAAIHRHDVLMREAQWRASPTFIIGLNYHFNSHWMLEFGGNYIAGFGESQLNPSTTFFPFLYSGYFRLAYRI